MDIEDDIVRLLFELTGKNNRTESDYYICADKMMDVCRDYGWKGPEEVRQYDITIEELNEKIFTLQNQVL